MSQRFIYTVAVVRNECCGHGDYRTIWKIDGGEYGKFPPCFETKAEAEAWMGTKLFHNPVQVVTLILNEKEK